MRMPDWIAVVEFVLAVWGAACIIRDTCADAIKRHAHVWKNSGLWAASAGGRARAYQQECACGAKRILDTTGGERPWTGADEALVQQGLGWHRDLRLLTASDVVKEMVR